ncbi:hypothetical protein D3C71_1287400 [compost metagenome]
MQNIDTRQFVDFLLASTNLSASKVSKALGFPSSKLTTMKNSNSKLTNQFIQKVEEKLGLTIEDFYAYQEDPSNLKSVTVEVDESESVNYDTKKMYDKRKAPDYVDAKTYIEFLVKATGKKVTAIPGELGLSHSYLSNIKQGKTPLYMELIKNVQAVFGLTINDYYTYTQSGEVPNLNQNQESVESQPLLDLTKQSQFLTFICFLEETNIANIASDTGYSLQDMVEINAGRLQIDQNFIDAINECYSIDSLNQFNSIVGNGIINMYDIQDLRNQGFQEVAPTKE